MSDIQNEIDQLRRQLLTLELLSCVLHNQLGGEPDKRTSERQKKLLMSSASECAHMEEKIDHLVKQRNRSFREQGGYPTRSRIILSDP